MRNNKIAFPLKSSSIMISTVITIAVSYTIIISVIFAALFNSIEKTVISEHLLMGRKYATIFEYKINNALNYLSIVASTLEAQAGSLSADREKLQKTILNVFDNYKLIDGSSVYFEPDIYDGKDAQYIGTKYGTAASGRICFYFYTDDGKTAYLPEGLENDIEFDLPHYINAKESNAPIYTEPVVHNIDGRDIHMFTITYPIRNINNEFIGAVTVDLFLDDLYNQLQNEKIYDTGYIVITSDNNPIVYSPLYNDIGKSWYDVKYNYKLPAENDEVAYSYAPSLINSKNSFTTTISLNIPLLESKFYISVSAPVFEIYSNMFWIMAILSLFSLVIMTIILLILRSKIVKPLKEITTSANKIADGYLDEVIKLDGIDENTKTNNEIQILSISLKKMLAEINEMQKIKLESLEFQNEMLKAEESSKTKSAFLANMSHEIRTPMNAIVGMSELILREDISPVIYEHTVSIKNAGANLLSIINDILDFSKIESGKLEIINSEYIFASLVNDVLSIIRMRITEKNILFVANIDSNIPHKLIGDEVRVRQVLLNLLSNAVKYTDEGFISITIDGVLDDNNTVVLTIEIADSGIGIKEEDIGKLFGDFVQVDTIKNKSIEGTGLGLAIAKNICQLMGGDISVFSEYGTGSTFTITIPQKFNVYEKFAHVENPDNKQVLVYEPREIYANSIVCTIDNLGVHCTLADTQSKLYEELKFCHYPFIFVSSFLFESTKRVVESLGLNSKIVLMSEFGEVVAHSNVRTMAMPVHSISVANILNDVSDNISFNQIKETYSRFIAPTAKVLIVDDISTNLRVAEGLMTPYKMAIDVCKSGAEAIELVQQQKYDIIFMDHMMPEMDGIEATYRIRSIEDESGYYKNVPIIALTANAISGVKEMFIKNGMDDFLAKPIDISKLNKKLEKWIPHEKQKKNEANDEPIPIAVDFEIDGVNINTGIFMTGGTVELYLRTLAIFRKDGEDKINEIRECVAKNDLQLYTTFVHAIKSASSSIGANEISHFAYKLETAGRNEDIEFIKNNTEIFLQQLAALLQNIDSVIAERPENHADNKLTAVNSEFLKTELIKLKSALEDVNIGEINAILGRLEANAWDKKLSDCIYNISQNIILFEYDKSIVLIDELLSAS